jgi:hypothetical protein
VLDDTGRCMYCKSKIYDLTDINIDMNSNDIMLMKVKHGDQTIIMKVRPVNMSIKMEPLYNAFMDMDFNQHIIPIDNDLTIDLELKGC